MPAPPPSPSRGNLKLQIAIEHFPIAGTFAIARGSRTIATVVTATITDGIHIGRGECTPYARYAETPEGVAAAIAAAPLDRAQLARTTPPGAARNAVDCALWDFEAKSAGTSVAALAGLPLSQSCLTAYTLSLDSADAMAAAARRHADKPLLKIKLGSPGDIDRLNAIRSARPDARIIVDANEGWTAANLDSMIAAAATAGVELIEQPLPAALDHLLANRTRAVPLCADESFHTHADLPRIAALYDAVNIKLDKTGGLTEALAVRAEARRHGLKIMVGCMVATSLAMAPAHLIAQGAEWVDLDGPLLLAADRTPGLTYTGAVVSAPEPSLWG